MTHTAERCRCGLALDSKALNCKACREAANAKQTKRYNDLKAGGRCTWCGVPATLNPRTGELDQFCRKHRIARNKYLRDRKTARERANAKNPG